MSAAGKRHMARVAALPCVVCGAQPVEVHHILEGRTPGRRSSDWLVLPVCPEHHRGTHGIHGTRQSWSMARVSEMHALADTLERVYG